MTPYGEAWLLYFLTGVFMLGRQLGFIVGNIIDRRLTASARYDRNDSGRGRVLNPTGQAKRSPTLPAPTTDRQKARSMDTRRLPSRRKASHSFIAKYPGECRRCGKQLKHKKVYYTRQGHVVHVGCPKVDR